MLPSAIWFASLTYFCSAKIFGFAEKRPSAGPSACRRCGQEENSHPWVNDHLGSAISDENVHWIATPESMTILVCLWRGKMCIDIGWINRIESWNFPLNEMCIPRHLKRTCSDASCSNEYEDLIARVAKALGKWTSTNEYGQTTNSQPWVGDHLGSAIADENMHALRWICEHRSVYKYLKSTHLNTDDRIPIPE